MKCIKSSLSSRAPNVANKFNNCSNKFTLFNWKHLLKTEMLYWEYNYVRPVFHKIAALVSAGQKFHIRNVIM